MAGNQHQPEDDASKVHKMLRRLSSTQLKRWGIKHSVTSKIKKVCVLCGENRAVDYCHVIPYSMIMRIEEMPELHDDHRNYIALCKTHHWLYDHMGLSKNEVILIYNSCDKFIRGWLFRLANSSIGPKENCKLRTAELNQIAKFRIWIDWFAEIVYILNPT